MPGSRVRRGDARSAKANRMRWLWFLFANYLWLGILTILATVLANNYLGSPSFGAKVVLDTVEAVGVAIVVASIFTYASGTSQFMSKIRALLQDIVVSRDFLGNIDSASKREALSALLKPTSEERSIYSNIEDYYNYYITQALDISRKCVRSNYAVHYRAFIDHASNRVAADGSYSYRLYPTVDGYNDIQVGFTESIASSTCHAVFVSSPKGERKAYDVPKLEEIAKGGDQYRLATIDLKDIGRGEPHLDIEIRVTEYGSDHWLLLQFQALQPTDGFSFHLRCEDGLAIRDHDIFVFGAKYFVDRKNCEEIFISCNQWINEGSGLVVLVSIPHELTPSAARDRGRIGE